MSGIPLGLSFKPDGRTLAVADSVDTGARISTIDMTTEQVSTLFTSATIAGTNAR